MDAGVLVAALSQELKSKSIPLSTHLKARYGKEFKQALAKDVSEAELYRAIARIAERWEEHQLTLAQALRDTKGQHRNGTGRTSEEIKAAADARIGQAMEVGLLKADPRRPLSKEEKTRAKTIDDELAEWRANAAGVVGLQKEAVS